jgi:hypothetical protein
MTKPQKQMTIPMTDDLEARIQTVADEKGWKKTRAAFFILDEHTPTLLDEHTPTRRKAPKRK